MKAMHSAPPGKAWKLGKGPFVFSGAPPACAGEVEVINTSGDRLKVRGIPIAGGDLAAAATEVRLAASVEPNGRVRVPAHIPIQPATPSGTYETTLACGRQSEPAVIHVFESRRYDLSPRRVVLRGSGGETASHPLVVRNLGNTALAFPDVSMVWLEERDWVGRTLVDTLRDSPDAEAHREFLDRLLGELRSSMIPATRVLLECEPAEVPPGGTAQATLRLTLPRELRKRRTYLGFVKLPGRRLWLEVECNGAAEPERSS